MAGGNKGGGGGSVNFQIAQEKPATTLVMACMKSTELLCVWDREEIFSGPQHLTHIIFPPIKYCQGLSIS